MISPESKYVVTFGDGKQTVMSGTSLKVLLSTGAVVVDVEKV